MSKKKIILLIILFIAVLIGYYMVPTEYQTIYIASVSILYIFMTMLISFYRRREWLQ